MAQNKSRSIVRILDKLSNGPALNVQELNEEEESTPEELAKRQKKADMMERLGKHFPILPGDEEEEPLSMEEPNGMF